MRRKWKRDSERESAVVGYSFMSDQTRASCLAPRAPAAAKGLPLCWLPNVDRTSVAEQARAGGSARYAPLALGGVRWLRRDRLRHRGGQPHTILLGNQNSQPLWGRAGTRCRGTRRGRCTMKEEGLVVSGGDKRGVRHPALA